MVFVIAECGVNWRDLVDADQMIKAAAEAGADACKFQAYEEIPEYQPAFETLVMHPPLRPPTLEKIPAKGNPRAEELNAIRLNESIVRYLYWRCQQHGIEFMCTPMYPEAVPMLDPYVKRWKVRYGDRKNTDILVKIYETKKEVLISTDRDWMVSEDWKKEKPRLSKFLYCVSEYPPPESATIPQLKGFEGYSCHIPLVEEAVAAADIMHLQYLEVHVRLDHYEPPHYCPIDTAVSITMSELAELCRRLKK